MYIHLPIAEMTIFLPELLGIALIIGLIAGLLGIGGGFILTPFMIAMGIPAGIAVGSSGGQVFSSSYAAFSRYYRKGSVDFQLALYLVGGGISGIILGTFLFKTLSEIGNIESILRGCFIIILLAVGSLLFVQSMQQIFKKSSSVKMIASEDHPQNIQKTLLRATYFPQSNCHVNISLLIITSFIIGIISGLLGIGGGFLIVPALIYMHKIPARAALALSQTNIMSVSFIGLFMHAILNKNVDPFLSLLLVVAGAIGATAGARFADQMPQKLMRPIFAFLICGTAAFLIYDTYFIDMQKYIIIRHSL